MVKPLTYSEGYQRGKEDKLGQYAADPYRWAKSWAFNFYKFEQGYMNGHAETVRD